MIMLGMSPFIQRIVLGVILIVAVRLDTLRTPATARGK